MKERILKLSKRLNKFMLDEISLIAEDIKESVLIPILEELVQEQKLIKRGDLYLYKKPVPKSKQQMFQMHDKQTSDLILKCFCSNIPTNVACNLVGISDDCIGRFYKIYREQLYLRQELELKNKFINDPQHARNRMFFNQEVHFYTYNNIVYVSEKILENISDNRFLSKEENKEFKKVYSYITRILFHNKNEYYLFNKIAEGIWRRNKTFEEMYSDLKTLLFS